MHPLQLNSLWASLTVRWTNHRLITDCRNVKSKKDDTRKLATVGECGRTESSDERNYAIKIVHVSFFIGAEQNDDPDERPEGADSRIFTCESHKFIKEFMGGKNQMFHITFSDITSWQHHLVSSLNWVTSGTYEPGETTA